MRKVQEKLLNSLKEQNYRNKFKLSIIKEFKNLFFTSNHPLTWDEKNKILNYVDSLSDEGFKEFLKKMENSDQTQLLEIKQIILNYK